jgi:hypothetical protein
MRNAFTPLGWLFMIVCAYLVLAGVIGTIALIIVVFG